MDTPTLSTRILLVDDDLKLCRLVRQYLEPLGYTVSLAHNGEDGLHAALAGNFDAIILDVMMPKLDGFGLLAALREAPELRGVPVLLLSARAGEEAKIEGLSAGADDYLT